MRRAKWIVAVVAVIALVVLLRYTIFAPDVVEVRTAAVERGVVEQTVTNTRAGTVKVRLRAELSPQVGGLVVALPHREGDISEAQLRDADEVWLTSSSKEVIPVTRLNGKPVADGRPGPLWKRMTGLYQEYKAQLQKGEF